MNRILLCMKTFVTQIKTRVKTTIDRNVIVQVISGRNVEPEK